MYKEEGIDAEDMVFKKDDKDDNDDFKLPTRDEVLREQDWERDVEIKIKDYLSKEVEVLDPAYDK